VHVYDADAHVYVADMHACVCCWCAAGKQNKKGQKPVQDVAGSSQDEQDDIDVDLLFESSGEEETVSYDCVTCGKSIGALSECYPAEHRKGGSLFYCQKCYNGRVPPGPDKGADQVVDGILEDFAQEKRLGLGLRLEQLLFAL
jgi:hypothetical protein